MSAGYKDPEVVDPRTLIAGDQVGCGDYGPRLQVLLDLDRVEDAVWLTVRNEPGSDGDAWWGRPVNGRHIQPDGEPARWTGEVTLHLADGGHDLRKVGVLPRVLARRAVPA